MSDVGFATTTAAVQGLPVHSWLVGSRRLDKAFDKAVLGLCNGPTIDLGCGPGRFVAHLTKLGIPALGVDQSQTAVEMARRSGAPALRRDVFERLPGIGRWGTVLLADGNVGLGGDPSRVLRRAGELMRIGRPLCRRVRPERSAECNTVGSDWNPRRPWAVVPVGLGRRRLRQAASPKRSGSRSPPSCRSATGCWRAWPPLSGVPAAHRLVWAMANKPPTPSAYTTMTARESAPIRAMRR